MPQRSKSADQHHEKCDHRRLGIAPEEGHDWCQDQQATQARIEHRRRRTVVAGQDTRQDDEEGVTEHPGEGIQGGRMHMAKSRPCHHQYADETDSNRNHAPWPHPFAQQRPRDQGHHEGCQENDAHGLCELQILQAHEIQDGGGKQQQRARHLHPGLSGQRQTRLRPGIERERDKHHAGDIARPGRFDHADARRQPFGDAVEAGKTHQRGTHQRDTDQPLPGLRAVRVG